MCVGKTVSLPDRETMLERLSAVDNDPVLVERFYPQLLEEADKRLTVAGLVITLQILVENYVDDHPSAAPQLSAHFEAYLDAMANDKTAADEAKEHYQLAMCA